MVGLFLEKEVFETIILNDDKYPFTNKILGRNVPVLINMTSEEFDKEQESDESLIMLALQEKAGLKNPIPLKSEFEEILSDFSNVINHPQYIYVLNIEEEEAKNVGSKYGAHVISSKKFKDDILKGGLNKTLSLEEEIKDGWKHFFKHDWVKGNSLVISDSYLFQNFEGTKNRGLENVKEFMNAYLPDHLDAEFHLTIIADNDPPFKSSGKKPEWWEKNFGDLKAYINTLRDYDVVAELYLGTTIHKRVFISNYIYSSFDKGFDIFKCNSSNKIAGDNHAKINHIFDNIDDWEEVFFQSSMKELESLNNKCNTIAAHVSKNRKSTFSHMAMGVNKTDRKSKNRLFY